MRGYVLFCLLSVVLVGPRCARSPSPECPPATEAPDLPYLVTPLGPYALFQHVGGVASVPIAGVYDPLDPPALVEARLTYEGDPRGSWAVVDPAPQNGAFGGELAGMPVGRGLLQVRLVRADGSDTILALDGVGVGVVIAVIGQSNAIGRAGTERLSTAAPPGSSYPTWASMYPLSVLPGTPLVQWLRDPAHHQCDPASEGSPWTILADDIFAETGMPIMFVMAAHGGTGLVYPPDWKLDGLLWESFLDRMEEATAGANCVSAVLIHQGETDSLYYSLVPDGAYAAGLLSLANDLEATMTCSAHLVVARIHLTHNNSQIRNEQNAAVGLHAAIHAGPDTLGLPLQSDGLHFSDAAMEPLAEMWLDALLAIPSVQDLLFPQ